MVHLIVAITGAHRAPDLPLAAAVALWLSCASGSPCKSGTSRKTVALFTVFDRLQLCRLWVRETTGCHVIHRL